MEWKILFPRDKTISIHNWKLLARALNIPKTSKRIQKKMMKKRIMEWLLADNGVWATPSPDNDILPGDAV